MPQMSRQQILTAIADYTAANGQQMVGPGGAAGGTIESFPFALMPSNRFTAIALFSLDGASAGKAALAAVKKELAAADIKLFGSAASGRPGDILVANLDPELLGNEFITLGMCRVVRALQSAGIRPAYRCGLCGGEEGCDILAEYRGGYRPMHRSCAEHPIDAIAKNPEANYRAADLRKGALGAAVGLLIGALGHALLSIPLGSLALTFAFFMIPLLTYEGYKKLGGKPTKSGVYVIAGLLLLGLLLSYTTVGTAVFVQQGGLALGASIAASIGSLFSASGLALLLKTGWLYLLVAAWVVFRAHKDSKAFSPENIARAAENLLSTASDYDLSKTIRMESN